MFDPDQDDLDRWFSDGGAVFPGEED